jgi:hypothetical protein
MEPVTRVLRGTANVGELRKASRVLCHAALIA